jgi:hypothetical protein
MDINQGAQQNQAQGLGGSGNLNNGLGYSTPCPSCGYCPACGQSRYSNWPYYYTSPTWRVTTPQTSTFGQAAR